MKYRDSCVLICAMGLVLCAGCDEFTGERSSENNTTVGPASTSSGSFVETKASQDSVTEIPPDVLDYFHRSVIERKRIQRELRSQITQLKRRGRGVRSTDQKQAIEDEIAQREAKVEELNGEYPVPPMNLARLHEGELGGIGRVHVVDVREGSTALVCQSTDLSRKHVVILKLLSFVNMEPGEERIFENAFEVTGTEKIKMPRGERSVFVLKVKRDVQLDPYKPLYAKLHPQSSDTEPPSSTESPIASKNEPKDPTDSASSTPDPKPVDKKSDEAAAAGKLKLAKVFVEKGNKSVARKRLQAIVDDFPETKAGKEAKTLLEDLK